MSNLSDKLKEQYKPSAMIRNCLRFLHKGGKTKSTGWRPRGLCGAIEEYKRSEVRKFIKSGKADELSVVELRDILWTNGRQLTDLIDRHLQGSAFAEDWLRRRGVDNNEMRVVDGPGWWPSPAMQQWRCEWAERIAQHFEAQGK